MSRTESYLLITTAYNEEPFIEGLVHSVVSQTMRPTAWIIVDDGSTDGTREELEQHAAQHAFITLLERPVTTKLGYLSKVEALNLALDHAKGFPVDFVGILDADVSMGPRYFEEVLGRFAASPELGLAGGSIFEKNGHGYRRHRVNRNSVSGAVQFYRAEVIRQVTPFRPFEHGGEDAACEILTRAAGWRTQTFRDLRVYHHKPVGLGPRKTYLGKRFRKGMMFYDLGYAPLFHAARAIGRLWEQPVLIGSVVEIVGHLYRAYSTRRPLLPAPAVRFVRNEQRHRLLGRLLPSSPQTRSTRFSASRSPFMGMRTPK